MLRTIGASRRLTMATLNHTINDTEASVEMCSVTETEGEEQDTTTTTFSGPEVCAQKPTRM